MKQNISHIQSAGYKMVKENERKISYVGSSNSSIITQDQNATELWLAIRKLSTMNASVSEQLIDVQQEIVKLDQKVINISKTSGPRGPPGYNGTQGLPGTFGVPGYNGTQGLPGPPGSSVSGKLSLCSYMTAGKKFLGVNCDSNDAKFVVMSSTESGGKRTYKCKCDMTLGMWRLYYVLLHSLLGMSNLILQGIVSCQLQPKYQR
ncbi:hypothetical protein OS493_037948 [Desmophyllum pertusum]|uniref:Uncharacterized protein n=1 Tax=Desmophyllum pertusum TaxID=174260 RepID=A0A9X0D083_9CNID|nr:hypothetical protein OS493_037948 [Desmophyllum pertusum]